MRNPELPKFSWKMTNILILASFSILSLGIYLTVSRLYFRIGFPLDDAWIHQTYARNLVVYREWSFIPGIPSAGSTSPLWSALLSIGYLIRAGPYIWTFAANGIFLFLLGFFGQRIFEKLSHRLQPIPWVGILLITEWHMVWAAGSGMEILFFCVVCSMVFSELCNDPIIGWRVGILIGILIWIRPEGITLLGPAILVAILRRGEKKSRLLNVMLIGTVATFFLFAYLFFNYQLSGRWLSNTFYAKQAEYSIQLLEPLLLRFGKIIFEPFKGVGILLIPGIVYFIIISIIKRHWEVMAIFLWIIGFCLIYTLKLPVTYQYGRYVMPIIPGIVILGLCGTGMLISQPNQKIIKLLMLTWKYAIIAIALAFFIRGASIFAADVAIIETEMVDTSQWIASNIDSKAIIAAHDIGALGFFGQHKIIDLAGLVTPDVIPFIRNEDRLAEYMNSMNADYLMTFPDWYPKLIISGDMIYQSIGTYAPQNNGTNMQVIEWNK